MKKTFAEVTMQLTKDSDLNHQTAQLLGIAATYLKGGFDILKNLDLSDRSPQRQDALRQAADGARDGVFHTLLTLTNDDVRDNLLDLIDASL